MGSVKSLTGKKRGREPFLDKHLLYEKNSARVRPLEGPGNAQQSGCPLTFLSRYNRRGPAGPLLLQLRQPTALSPWSPQKTALGFEVLFPAPRWCTGSGRGPRQALSLPGVP